MPRTLKIVFYIEIIVEFHFQVNIEEVLSVEVSTSRAVGVGACVPITALVQGVSHRYLSTGRAPDFRTSGYVTIKDGVLCGTQEGTGNVRASYAGVWSPEVEVSAKSFHTFMYFRISLVRFSIQILKLCN